MATMKNKPVSFNIDNDEDKRRLDHINHFKNFSGYIKGLIDQDMKKPDVERTPGGGIKITKSLNQSKL